MTLPRWALIGWRADTDADAETDADAGTEFAAHGADSPISRPWEKYGPASGVSRE